MIFFQSRCFKVEKNGSKGPFKVEKQQKTNKKTLFVGFPVKQKMGRGTSICPFIDVLSSEPPCILSACSACCHLRAREKVPRRLLIIISLSGEPGSQEQGWGRLSGFEGHKPKFI